MSTKITQATTVGRQGGRRPLFSIRSRAVATASASAALLAAGAVLAIGCGSTVEVSETTSVSEPAVTTATAQAPVGLRVAEYATPSVKIVTSSSVVVRGRVTPGAEVDVAGRRARVNGRRWSVRVPLDEGPNRLTATAQKRGLSTTTVTFAIVRV